MQITISWHRHSKKQVTTISLSRRLLRKGIAFVSRLTMFRYGTVVIFHHAQSRDLAQSCDLTCPDEIRRVDWNNVDDALYMESPERVAHFRSLLQNGEAGYYAYLNGVVVHRHWVQFGPGIVQCELGVTFRLKEGDSYAKYGTTHPAARRKGILTAVLGQITNDMHAQGRNLYAATVQNNVASIRGIEKAGFRLFRRVRSVVCFGVSVLQIDLGVSV